MSWLTDWNWAPSVLLGLIVFCALYLYGIGPLRKRLGGAPVERGKIVSFFLGAFIIFIALVSPIDELGDHYLFSAHMTQHMLLTLAMPPLVLLGTPGWLLTPFLKSSAILRLARVLTTPVIALLLFNTLFVAYHIPALYEGALQDHNLHILVHLILMAAAVITWMPILSPTDLLPRSSSGVQILYLFFGAIPPTILGAVITFASVVLYPTYAAAPRLFGVSALEDQQIAGLIMWIPGASIYLGALTIVFFKWFGQGESAEQMMR